jgi:hypothetical protein
VYSNEPIDLARRTLASQSLVQHSLRIHFLRTKQLAAC